MTDKIKATFARNVKYNRDLYAKGASAEFDRPTYEELLRAGVLLGGGELPPIADESPKTDEETGFVDLYLLSRSQLDRKSKKDLIEFLRAEEIPFDEKANKDELVDLIAGE